MLAGFVMPGILDSDFIPPYDDAVADDAKLLLCKYELCKLFCDDVINGDVYKCEEIVADELLSCEDVVEAVADDEFDGDCKSYFDGEFTFDAAACMLANGDGSA